MKKTLVSSILFLVANAAQAQEIAQETVAPFWQDKTFLMLAGGAVFLIILLIVKKAMGNRSVKQSSGNENL